MRIAVMRPVITGLSTRGTRTCRAARSKSSSITLLSCTLTSSRCRAADAQLQARFTNTPSFVRYISVRHTHGPSAPRSVPVLPKWLVQHAVVVRALPAIGNGAYAALACGFLMTDILALRMLLVGGYSGLVTYHALQAQPLRIPLRWSMFFVMINAAMVAKLVLDQLPIKLSEDEETLHVRSFAPLSRAQFKRLLDIGERVTFADGTCMTEEGISRPELFFIVTGSANLTVKGKITSRLGPGSFPNALAFQRTGWEDDRVRTASHRDLFWPAAYGTARCNGNVEAIVWRCDSLFKLLDSEPEMRQRMGHVVVEAIVRPCLSVCMLMWPDARACLH